MKTTVEETVTYFGIIWTIYRPHDDDDDDDELVTSFR
jgi:hypothetical protein